MKPGPVDLSAASEPADILRCVIGVRLAEAGALANALQSGKAEELHQFRIACKRLRYALERFGAIEPVFEATATHLSHLQDALGEAHDCDLLLLALPPPMVKTRDRLREHRLTNAIHAQRLWADALVLLGETFRFSANAASPSRETAR
jgi:CHAD domain-containing protein